MIKLLQFLYLNGRSACPKALLLLTLAALARATLVIWITKAISNTYGIGTALSVACALLIVHLVVGHFARMAAHELAEATQLELRVRLMREILSADAGLFIGREKADLYNTMTFDIANIATSAVRLVSIGQALVLSGICYMYVFWLSPAAGLAGTVFIGCAALAAKAHDRKARAALAAASRVGSGFYSRVEDALNGFAEISLNRQRRSDLFSHSAQIIRDARDLSIQAERHFSFTSIASQSALFIFLGVVVFLMPVFGWLDTTTAVKLLTIALFLYGPIDSLASNYPMLAKACVSVDRVSAFEAEFVRDQSSESKVISNVSAGFKKLSLQDVTITLGRYNSAAGKWGPIDVENFEIGPINLEIRKGEIVFINGANGAGKTTLLSIICGLRQPDGGRLLIDGVPLEERHLGSYKANFTAVFSDYHLFRRLYGLPEEQVERLTGLLDELDVGHRVGLNSNEFQPFRLSAGQRRRVALAVALAENRPVLLLDEFAADQDAANRTSFYEELLPQLRAQGKTVIAITHDESRLHCCDWLVQLENGKIVTVTPGRYNQRFGRPELATGA
jgi:putative pyoverdin transport system ATP-binding/permease protein